MNVVAIGPGYECDPPGRVGERQKPHRLPVIAVAEDDTGAYRACVFIEGRLEFAPGPVFPLPKAQPKSE